MSTTSAVFRIALVLAAFTSVALAAQSDQSERVVIISLTGDWKLDGATVVFGQRLPAQGCLFGSEGSVVLQSEKKGGSAQPFICEKPSRDSSCTGHQSARCAVPLNPRNWKASGGGLGNIWDAVARLFTGEPDRYMVAASRGIEPGLVDTVVALQNSGVDLSPAFRELPAGQYWVKLETVNGNPSPQAASSNCDSFRNTPPSFPPQLSGPACTASSLSTNPASRRAPIPGF